MDQETEARFQRIERNLAKAVENQVTFQVEHDKRLAEWEVRHEKWKAEWEQMQKDFAATMHGYHIRAEQDMQTIREDLQEIAKNVKLLTTGRRGNGKKSGQ